MASHFNVPEEKLAENVLRGSLTDQLLMLAEFYKSKDKNTEAVFTPLVEEALKTGPNEQTNKSTNSNKSVPNDRTPEESIRIVVSPKRKSKTRETAQTDHNQPSNSKQQQKKKNVLVIEESSSKGMRCSETANSCEAVGGQSTSVNRNPLSTSLCDVSSNVDNQTTTITDTNMSQIASGEHPVNEATNQQPPTDGLSERKETTEELEAFLFGDLPCVAKTPPRKKCKKGAEFATGPTRVEPGFVKPSLTFDSTKWSPSRQRDLLSIAQDIAKLQRSLESGDLPQEPVSKLVSFTKPSD